MVTTQLLNELHDLGYSQVTAEDVNRVYRTLLNMPIAELQHMISEAGMDVPVVFRITARHILGKEGFAVIEQMLNRVFGKPINTLADINGNDDSQERTVLVIEIPNNPLLRGEEVDYETISTTRKQG